MRTDGLMLGGHVNYETNFKELIVALDAFLRTVARSHNDTVRCTYSWTMQQLWAQALHTVRKQPPNCAGPLRVLRQFYHEVRICTIEALYDHVPEDDFKASLKLALDDYGVLPTSTRSEKFSSPPPSQHRVSLDPPNTTTTTTTTERTYSLMDFVVKPQRQRRRRRRK